MRTRASSPCRRRGGTCSLRPAATRERDFSDAYSFDLHSKYWEKLTNVSQGGDGITGGGGSASSSKGNSKAVAAPAVTQAACALPLSGARR